jgi:phosphate transport system permease protein
MTNDLDRGRAADLRRPGQPFTGKARRRTTSRRVRVMEVVSRVLVTAGGLGTIVAVSLIFAFLFAVVVPVFQRADVQASEVIDLPSPSIAALGLDRYEVVKWVADREGSVRSMRVEDGAPVAEVSLVRDGAGAPTTQSYSPGHSRAVFGYADGAVVLVDIGFEESFASDAEVPGYESLAVGATAAHDGGVVQRTPVGQLRTNRLVWKSAEPDFPHGDVAIAHADATLTSTGPCYASLAVDGTLVLSRIRVRRSMVGDETRTASRTKLPYAQPEGAGLPLYFFLDARGSDVQLLWEDGRYQRYRVGSNGPELAEEADLLSDPARRVTAATQILGEETIAIADDGGGLATWFMAPSVEDEKKLVTVSPGLLEPLEGGHFTALAASSNSRLLIGGSNDGRVVVFQATTQGAVGEASSRLDGPITALEISSEEKTILAAADGRVARLAIDPKHPDASLHSLFGKVWYEGYPEPQHVWQSTSGTDTFEAKLGLIPLVFGTLKATFYSMIFGAPLALLAALFTSEFLGARLRARVKIVMELMASLPSVVLGFLGGLVIAPFVQDELSGVLGVLFALPLCFLLGAHLFQLVPRRLAVPWSTGWQRFAMVAAAIPLAVLLGATVGPLFERLFFGGDTSAWLSSRDPAGAGSGWAFILLPLSFVAVAFLVQRFVEPFIRDRFAHSEHGALARLHLVKFVVAGAAAIALAFALGHGLAGAGIDPRGGMVDTYVQRNALVVGFVMGFAIIPIIYTLAEDALSSVPQHLRQASLGAGATQWQTAMRVIVPTAMSGLFSAVMVGLGRAVGETMIVLMATGSTPIMDFNVFNGFRTLSANIATELPEAVKGSTHYRVLFLAALTLFAMTFVLNTLAEVVRQRFRKRAFQL